jgi:flagellar motor switch protein FliN
MSVDPIAEQPYDVPGVGDGSAFADPGFDPAGAQLEALAGAGPSTEGDLGRLHDVPVELAVELGRTHMTIGDTLALGPGSIITLNRMAGEPVDLLVNGLPIARGEVVVIDEEFGLRVTEVVGSPMAGGAIG